jgi:hypothetical protein
MADFTFKVKNTFPFLEATLTMEGQPINLTNATSVTVRLKGLSSPNTLITGACTYPSPTTGNVIYAWKTTDTEHEGEYEAEWEIAWNNGTISSVPNEGTKRVAFVKRVA